MQNLHFLETALRMTRKMFVGSGGRGHLRPWPDRPVRTATAPRYVLIGSGIANLTAGALLAHAGLRVTVLEKHPHGFGGHARSIEVDGLEFCVGPQYLWGFGQGEIAHRVLARLGLADTISFTPMAEDGFERCWVGEGEPFDTPVGLPRFCEALSARFPSERKGLTQFFAAVSLAFEGARVLHDDGVYLEDGTTIRMALALSTRFSLAEKLRLLKASGQSLADVFDACGLSPPVRRLLFAHAPIFCEPASALSFFVYSAATGYYHLGPVIPTRGFAHLISSLVDRIRASGGAVACGKAVTALPTTGSRVTRVVCSDDTFYPCDHVVSGLSPRLTNKLLDGCAPGPIPQAPPRSAVSCYVGLRDFPALHREFTGRNGWWQRGTGKVDFLSPDMSGPPEVLYLGSPTAQGYGNTPRNESDQGLVLCAPGNHAQARAAESTGQLDALKSSIAKQMLACAERHVLPGLRKHVRFVEVRTPVDIERDTSAEAGNIFGRRLDTDTMLRGVRKLPGVTNVDMACASVALPGVENGINIGRLLVERHTGFAV